MRTLSIRTCWPSSRADDLKVSPRLRLAATREPGTALATIVGWGAAFGFVSPWIQIGLYRADPELFEASSAVMVTVFQIALGSGLWVGGMAIDRTDLQVPVLAGGCLAAVGVAAMRACRTPMPDETPMQNSQVEP